MFSSWARQPSAKPGKRKENIICHLHHIHDVPPTHTHTANSHCNERTEQRPPTTSLLLSNPSKRKITPSFFFYFFFCPIFCFVKILFPPTQFSGNAHQLQKYYNDVLYFSWHTIISMENRKLYSNDNSGLFPFTKFHVFDPSSVKFWFNFHSTHERTPLESCGLGEGGSRRCGSRGLCRDRSRPTQDIRFLPILPPLLVQPSKPRANTRSNLPFIIIIIISIFYRTYLFLSPSFCLQRFSL